jgi:AraC-like DNA-binding protein/mannose-6-phosphate isomerase-like protein (cupin superfamily)
MSEQIRQAWLTAPERRYKDYATSTVSKDAEKLRDLILQVGLAALSSNDPASLLLPPEKSLLSKRGDPSKDLHHHRYVEVGIVTRGEMTLWWEGTLAQIPAGTVFVIPPAMRYQPHASAPNVPQQPHSVVWLALHRGCAVVHQCSLKGDSHQLSEYYSFVEMQLTNQSRIIAQELADRSPYYATVIRGSLCCLLTWLLRAPVHRISTLSSASRDINVDGQDSFSDRVQSYLLSHYHRPVSLAQVARSVGCSPAYLCRHYRELTGQTPFQYLREIRIDAAKRLLGSEVPIARVAEMVGFDDPLYFSKVFSSHTGESPQRYRAHCHNQKLKGAA